MTHSKSAKNKLVVLADLPNSSIPNIGIIPSHYLFPVLGSLSGNPPFYLHSDGSIYQLFEMNGFSMPVVGKMIDGMPEDSSIQFYRIHKTGEDAGRFFFSVRAGIDYAFIDLEGKKFFDSFFKSYRIYGDELEKLTAERYQEIMKIIPEDAVRVGYDGNELYEYLCDYECEENFAYTKYPIKSNISAILTGKSKHSCVFSINNLDAIPLNHGVLHDFDFLEVTSLVKPSIKQLAAIEKTIDVNRGILTAIRPDNIEKREVEVDTMKKDISHILKEIRASIFFVNVSFCLKSNKSLSELRERFSEFEDAMYKKGIVLYCHSNSARAQYISLFPGNSVYGEHWNKAYRQFSLMLTSKVMAL